MRKRHRKGWISGLHQIRSLAFQDLRDLARAQRYLIQARLSLLLAPRGSLLATAEAGARAPGRGASARRAARLALAVDRTADYGLFRPTCLVRSIALERLLRHERLDTAVVRIGVRNRGGRMEAHAWIEIDGAVVGDVPEHTATFTPLGAFTAVTRA